MLHEEEEIDKEFAKFLNKQNELENTIYSKLEEKVAHDKAARYLNKLLVDSKERIQEQELSLVETENSYGKKLLELEQLNATISHEKTELEELSQSNNAKEKEIDEIQKEIKKHDATIERKQTKIATLNKTIEEVRLNILLQIKLFKILFKEKNTKMLKTPFNLYNLCLFTDIITHWRRGSESTRNENSNFGKKYRRDTAG